MKKKKLPQRIKQLKALIAKGRTGRYSYIGHGGQLIDLSGIKALLHRTK
jgi:hypothetical protein